MVRAADEGGCNDDGNDGGEWTLVILELPLRLEMNFPKRTDKWNQCKQLYLKVNIEEFIVF